MRNGDGIRQLLLYRVALDPGGPGEDDEVDVLAIVEGYVANVRCSQCGQVRTWIPGQESLERLIKQARRARGHGERCPDCGCTEGHRAECALG